MGIFPALALFLFAYNFGDEGIALYCSVQSCYLVFWGKSKSSLKSFRESVKSQTLEGKSKLFNVF